MLRLGLGVLLAASCIGLAFGCSSRSTSFNGDGSGGSAADAGSDEGSDGGTSSSGGSGAGTSSGGSNGSGGSDGSGGSTSGECPSTHECVSAVPEDWLGPVALGSGTCASSDGYPTSVMTLHSGLLPGNAVCDCQCGTPNTACTVSIVNWETGTCDANAINGTIADQNECDGMDYQGNTYVGVHVNATGSCVENDSGSNIPTPSWAVDARLCEGAEAAGGCGDGGTCLPQPGGAFADLCVYREGDHDCPAGFPVKNLLHEDYADDRACTTCTCGDLEGVQCSATVDFFAGTSCAVAPDINNQIITNEQPPFCTAGGTYERARVEGITVSDNGSCSPSPTSVTGSANEVGPHTVCCR